MYNNKFINNKELYEFYTKYVNLFDSLRTVEDCYLFIKKLNIVDNDKKQLLLGIIDGKNNEISFDFKTMENIIMRLNKYKWREDILENIPEIMNKTNNLAQISTFTRIANMKDIKPVDIPERKIIKRDLLETKKCPHCDHICKESILTEYVICGYGVYGFDWNGCGKDWCFKCGKILCKSWEHDMLFIEENRIHDNQCCKKHAMATNKDYLDDYCHCSNNFVRRE